MSVFACYKDQNGEYQWTDRPEDGWQLIEGITRPDEIPQTKPEVSPMITPTPSPMPNQAPQDYQTTTTYIVNNPDGSYAMYDKSSGYELYSVKSDGTFTVLGDDCSNYNSINNYLNNLDASNISFDDKTAMITIRNSNNEPLLSIDNNLKIVKTYDYSDYGVDVYKYDYKGLYVGREERNNDGTVNVYSNNHNKIKTIYADGKYDIYENGNTIKFDPDNNKIKTSYADGSYERYESDKTIKYDANTDKYSYFFNDGTEVDVKYDSNGNEYLYTLEDGTKIYLESNKKQLFLYPDGSFYNYENGAKGSYNIDTSGNITCIDSLNNTYIYNSNGIIIKSIDNSGKVVNYDYNNMTKMVINDSKTFVSRINHIEYDEEEYNAILKTLNNISESNIDGLFENVDNSISRFPDSYPRSISSIKSSVNEHIDLIKSLSEMTNYSLLAYQACDNELKDNLNSLIDALFDEKQSADAFKKSILFTIEDRDNDGILEYKLNTDFNNLYDNLIPTQVYVDENGNTLYFNNRGRLLSYDGNNIKINYGGEKFTLTFGKNGCAVLKDSNEKPINIFGEYNIASNQYGGNQGNFYKNVVNLLQDENVDMVLDKYFPNASFEEKTNYLTNVAFSGCGFVTMANLVFDRMEGYEEDFQNKFGYPMYNITYNNNEVSIDYNYEPLTLELCSECFGRDINGNAKSIGETKVSGMGSLEEIETEFYLVNKYNIYDYNKGKSFTKISAQSNYILYDNDGYKIINEGLNGHAMTLLEKTEDGKMYVSNWGSKYRVEVMPGGKVYEKEYPLSDYNGYITGSYRGVYDNYVVRYVKTDGQAYLTITREADLK